MKCCDLWNGDCYIRLNDMDLLLKDVDWYIYIYIYVECHEIDMMIERYELSIMLNNMEWHMTVRLLWLWKGIWIAMIHTEKCDCIRIEQREC